MTAKRDVLQCPDCKRPDALRIRREIDPNTAVCSYCGSSTSLANFAQEKRRDAIGTVFIGLLLVITGIAVWKFTDGWHGYFDTGAHYPGRSSGTQAFRESTEYDMMPFLRLLSFFAAAGGAVLAFMGFRRLKA